MRITINKNGSINQIVVHDCSGDQHYDMSRLNRHQRDGVRELIVDFWAKQNGFAPIYGKS